MGSALSAESVEAFLHRFRHFYDGVIRRIAFDFAPRSKSAAIDLMGQDGDHADAWVICTLRIDGVQEFIVQERAASFLVLSDGVKFLWDDGKVFVDFGTVEDEPDLNEIRSGGFYLSGQHIEWDVRPLADGEWL